MLVNYFRIFFPLKIKNNYIENANNPMTEVILYTNTNAFEILYL